MNTVTAEQIRTIQEYVQTHLPATLKRPYGYFKYPFIDPGSVYDGNLWDWDTFWAVYAMIGISETCADSAFRGLLIRHSKGNVLNFLDFQLDDGYVPMMVDSEEEGIPYLNRKHLEGVVLNMHKPFLCQQICLISGFTGSYDWIRDSIPKLEKYFDCYDRYYYFERPGLYVWADDVMIGVDNDPASFGRPRFSTANIFLNSFMVRELQSMALILSSCGNSPRSLKYLEKAEQLTAAIQKECWDTRDHFFYSVDVDVRTRSYDWFHRGLGVFWNTLPIKIRSWSGFLPLLTGIADDNQASFLAQHAADPETFRAPFGIRSLSKDEKMYNLEPTSNPSNWLGGIWIVTQYAVFRGLLNYGFKDQASELCRDVLRLLANDLRTSGTLHEYYNPETGEPIINGGFVNWNMLALSMVDELEGRPSASRFLPFERIS